MVLASQRANRCDRTRASAPARASVVEAIAQKQILHTREQDVRLVEGPASAPAGGEGSFGDHGDGDHPGRGGLAERLCAGSCGEIERFVQRMAHQDRVSPDFLQ